MLDRAYDFHVPNELRDVSRRHEQHVVELVARLRSSGVEDSLIERSVDRLIASYRNELMAAIKSLRGHGNA